MKKLKIIRLIISLVFLMLYILLYLEAFSLYPFIMRILGSFQIGTSLVKAAAGITLFSFPLLVLILLTAVFGRFYCSSICPFGTLQDVCSRTAFLFLNPRRSYQKSLSWIQYLLLITAGALFFLGSMVLINLFEPMSAFGRMTGLIFKPIAAFAGNIFAAMLERFHVFFFGQQNNPLISWSLIAYAGANFIFIFLLSAFRGRLYCNTFCPVGGLLSLIARISYFKLAFKSETCIACGNCETACKAGCIDFADHKLDFSRCIHCYNCLAVCPTGAIRFRGLKPVRERIDTSRRDFLKAVPAGFIGFILLMIPGKISSLVSRYVPVRYYKKNLILPPGAGNIDRFSSLCTGCNLCVSVCPNRVITPAVYHPEYKGILQPSVIYDRGYCLYDCVLCGEACPTGAIRELVPSVKRLTKMGKSNLIKENCIVYNEDLDCGACSEHCPTKAVYMVPYKGTLYGPEVNQRICIGCGACEHVCPSKPYKSIYVEGENPQGKAQPRRDKELKKNKPSGEDFPF